MCVPFAATALSALGLGGTATAAGATAAAGTAAAGAGLASTLATVGSLVSIGGQVAAGVQGARVANAQIAALEDAKAQERALNAQTDQRERVKFAGQIAQQRAELVARGVSLDSVTAIALGETAAREMSFNSQAIRSDGLARQTELTAEQRNARLTGITAKMKGTLGAAADLLKSAPDLWPGLRAGSAT